MKSSIPSIVLLLSVLTAGVSSLPAAEITGVTATPPSAELSSMKTAITVAFDFKFTHSQREMMSCGATISYTGGDPSEEIEVKPSTTKITRTKVYTKKGMYEATIAGHAIHGMPACMGSKFASVAIIGEAPMIEAGPSTATLQTTPRITGISVTEDYGGSFGPTRSVCVEGFGAAECTFKMVLTKGNAKFNYAGDYAVSNKKPAGYWKNLCYKVDNDLNITYHASVAGTGPNGCLGSASKDIVPLTTPALFSMTTPKTSYVMGEKIPLDIKFVKTACSYDMTVGKTGGESMPLAGFYGGPDASDHFDDIRQNMSGVSWGPGDWYVKVVPSEGLGVVTGSPACSKPPWGLQVHFTIKQSAQ